MRVQQGLVLVASPTGCGKHRVATALREANEVAQLCDEVRGTEHARALVGAATSGLALGVITGSDAAGAWLRLREMCEGKPDPTVELASRDVSLIAVRLVGRVLIVEIVQRHAGAKERWSSGSLWSDAMWHVEAGQLSRADAEAFCPPDDRTEACI